MQILVVEEKGLTVQQLREYCSDWDIAHATSTDESLALLHSTRFDAVVVDLMAPGTATGATVSRLVQKRFKGTACVLMSPWGPETRLRIERAIEETIHSKPLDAAAIKAIASLGSRGKR